MTHTYTRANQSLSFEYYSTISPMADAFDLDDPDGKHQAIGEEIYAIDAGCYTALLTPALDHYETTIKKGS